MITVETEPAQVPFKAVLLGGVFHTADGRVYRKTYAPSTTFFGVDEAWRPKRFDPDDMVYLGHPQVATEVPLESLDPLTFFIRNDAVYVRGELTLDGGIRIRRVGGPAEIVADTMLVTPCTIEGVARPIYPEPK